MKFFNFRMLCLLTMSLSLGAIKSKVHNKKTQNNEKIEKNSVKQSDLGVNKYKYTLQPLPYAYDALEPVISAQIMELHHKKHQQAYVDGLNAVLKDYPELQQKPLIELLKNLDEVPEKIRAAVQNHGGGVENHMFFWDCMSPKTNQKPSGAFLAHLVKTFGSYEAFQEKFETAAKTCFGSGWAWLCLDAQSDLVVINTPNQNSPYTQKLTPLLTLDVWEHAYYLQYCNRRMDYVKEFWSIVNWQMVQERYEKLVK